MLDLVMYKCKYIVINKYYNIGYILLLLQYFKSNFWKARGSGRDQPRGFEWNIDPDPPYTPLKAPGLIKPRFAVPSIAVSAAFGR